MQRSSPLPVEAVPVEAIIVEPQPVETVVVAESAAAPVVAEVISSHLPGRVVRTWLLICGATHWLFGVLSLIVALAILATIPVVNFLSLGYLLEASGRVSRSGRFRDGFVGIRKASRVGSVVLGTWLLILPLRLLADLRDTAHLIDPDSQPTGFLGALLIVATAVLIGQILWACYRGGKLRHFFWPAPIRLWRTLWEKNKFSRARDAVWEFVVELRLPYYFSLGLRGFVGAVAWLLIPVSIWGFAYAISADVPQPAFVLLSLCGGLVFALMMLYLPFLQAHFAAENRLRAMFEVGKVRALYKRAPLAFWIALFVALLFALPLYLLKIEMTPQEVVWLPSLVFVLFIFPARLLTGWALGRGRHQTTPRHFVFRWLGRLAALPVVGIFAVIVYMTQYLCWYGPASLLEQHVLLVPVPFLSL